MIAPVLFGLAVLGGLGFLLVLVLDVREEARRAPVSTVVWPTPATPEKVEDIARLRNELLDMYTMQAMATQPPAMEKN